MDTERWGRTTARKRYGGEGMKKMAEGGGIAKPNARRGSGPFPGQSEKGFYDTEASAVRDLKTHGNPPISMTDTDTRDIDRANALADPEHKDRDGYKRGGKVQKKAEGGEVPTPKADPRGYYPLNRYTDGKPVYGDMQRRQKVGDDPAGSGQRLYSGSKALQKDK